VQKEEEKEMVQSLLACVAGTVQEIFFKFRMLPLLQGEHLWCHSD